MAPTNLVVFGDQTVEKLSSIQALVRHSKTSAGARRFLGEATDVMQLLLDTLSKEDRKWNHEIHTLLGLAEDNINESDPNGIIATTLMCIGRLGELIVFAEEDPSIIGSEAVPTHVLAYCTGLLPAAALVAARDTAELYGLAKEIISIIFRMAFQITKRMRLIEDSNGNWAMTLTGVSVEQVQPILDKFHESENIPFTRRVAIGIVSQGWLTLVAAPSSLNRLFAWSKELDQAPRTKTDTNGPIHTPYLPRFDMDLVLGDSPLLNIPITSKARIVSPGSCKAYEHQTLRGLVEEMLIDIAHNVLYLGGTTEASISGLPPKESVEVIVAGPTGHLPAIQRSLQEKKMGFEIRKHKTAEEKKSASRGGSDDIAIIGMAGRFPGSDTITGFWEDLVAGKIQIKEIPKSRFDLDTYYDATGEKRNTTSAKYGAFLNNPGHFDNRLFNISPREAAQMDPLQRLLLHASYEALEMAGYSKDSTLSTDSNRIATYFGQASEDWREVLNNQGVDIYYVPGLSRPFAPSRLNYFYKWGGASYAIDAACATSTTAISLAASALLAHECDTALAGGGSVLVSPNAFSGLSRSGMISDTKGCRTYHDDADGYARGEGLGVVVLKRLEDALSDNDNIIGVLKGSARAYTSTSTSITHPSAESQMRIYQEVLRQSSTVPNEVSYVEMHGTGTQAGDFEEMTSVLKVMGQGRTKKNTLTVGAVKANVGHGEAVAGVTSLIKCIMMMREGQIPTQPGLPFKLNHNFPKLEKLNVQIAGLGKDLELKPSPASLNGKIKVMVNSFDASGGNTSLLVEEPPTRAAKVKNELPYHVVALSGRTSWSLKENAKRLVEYLTRSPNTKLADVAYTTTARRMHQVLRVTYTAQNTKELVSLIKADLAKDGPLEGKKKTPKVSIVLAFTGQGSQYSGMGKSLYKQSASFKDLIETYQQIASHHGLPDFIGIISGADDITKASAVRVQLATAALEIATAKLLKTWGIAPDLVIGHSLGEYAALCTSGVLSVSDALFLVGKRAQLMEKKLDAGEYSMLAVGKSLDAVSEVLKSESRSKWSHSDIACVNAPSVTVISGPVGEIQALKDHLEQNGTRATVLPVPYGFHSHHIDPILEEFEDIAKGVTYNAPNVPVASTLLGEIIPVNKTGVFSPKYLARQAREPVKFVPALELCKKAGFEADGTHFLEVGPEPVCLGLIRRSLTVTPGQLLPIFKSSEDNWSTITSALATLHKTGYTLNWREYYESFKNSLTLLDLPSYAFDTKDYWTPFVEPALKTVVQQVQAAPAAPAAPVVPEFSTTDLQWIESVDVNAKGVSATFASQTSHPQLYEAIQGHRVYGTTICSLSIFCDMAKSAAQYTWSKANPKKPVPSLTISNMEMSHALVVEEINPDQILKTVISYAPSESKADVSFHSINGGVRTEHGSCQINLEESSAAWLYGRSDTLFLVDARIESLKALGASGKAHRLLKPVVYKLFDSVVEYGKEYQGLEEVWIDPEFRDAVGTVKLADTSGKGNFLYNPFWMDTAVHLAGFLCNANLKYPEDIACLSTGFESWRSFEELKTGGTYTCYVTLQEVGNGGTLTGVAYVYSGSSLVLVTSGIKFQKMKKIALGAILNSAKQSKGGAKKAPESFRPTSAPKKAVVAPPPPQITHVQLPVFDQDSDFSSGAPTPDTNSELGDSNPTTKASSVTNDDDNVIDILLSIVATETGYGLEDMELSTSFADMGLDSLMAISIYAALTRDTGIELPATFFLDYATVEEAKAALVENYGASEPSKKASTAPEKSAPAPAPKQAPAPAPAAPAAPAEPVPEPTLEPPKQTASPSLTSRAVQLQGSNSSSGPKVFMFPDGSGSPANFIQLPALGADAAVYGMESPFIKSPAEYSGTVSELADVYLAAIKKEQPAGPYLLGGYSFGALYAYEVARKLLESNESVDGLLIIDMSVPKALSSAPTLTFEQLSGSGFVAAKGRFTTTQKTHITKAVESVTTYSPAPASRAPKKTILISSKSGLAAGKPESSELVQWARGNSSAPAQGWQSLVGDVDVQQVDADHFTLFKHPSISLVGDKFKAAVETFTN